jgi:hypothetical protein
LGRPGQQMSTSLTPDLWAVPLTCRGRPIASVMSLTGISSPAPGWLPLRSLPLGAPGPYYAGDVANGRAFTGTDWVTLPPPPGHPTGPSLTGAPPVLGKTPGAGLWLGIGVAFLFILALAYGVGELRNVSDVQGGDAAAADTKPGATSSPTPLPTAPASEASTAPPGPALKYARQMKRRGYSELTDGLWGKSGGSEQTAVTLTWKIRVVAPDGCPNGVYLEANVLDASNTVVSYVNDLLPSLPANQEAILDLTAARTAQGGTFHLEPTQANCR